MSLSPSFPQGAPTLAEVLLQRTFAKPPEPFVDGELTKALASAGPAAVVELGANNEAGQSDPDSHDADSGTKDASARTSDGDTPGRSVDVRV